jgi:transposase-like protein
MINRWRDLYRSLSFKLSYRDLVAMMTERGIDLAHTTISRWVQHYSPEFAKRWNRYAFLWVVHGGVTRRI